MEFTVIRGIESFFALIRKGISNVIELNELNDSENNYDIELTRKYIIKYTLFSLVWGIAGSMSLYDRCKFSHNLKKYWDSSILPPLHD